jgi:hypothetical protein
MDMGFHNPSVGVRKKKGEGVPYTMTKAARHTMYRRFIIPWIAGSICKKGGIKYAMDMGFWIP